MDLREVVCSVAGLVLMLTAQAVTELFGTPAMKRDLLSRLTRSVQKIP